MSELYACVEEREKGATYLELGRVGVAVGKDEERVEEEPESGGDSAEGDDHTREPVNGEYRTRREAKDRSIDTREGEQLHARTNHQHPSRSASKKTGRRHSPTPQRRTTPSRAAQAPYQTAPCAHARSTRAPPHAAPHRARRDRARALPTRAGGAPRSRCTAGGGPARARCACRLGPCPRSRESWGRVRVCRGRVWVGSSRRAGLRGRRILWRRLRRPRLRPRFRRRCRGCSRVCEVFFCGGYWGVDHPVQVWARRPRSQRGLLKLGWG